MGSVKLLERHNERLNKNYSNKDIDVSRSAENYHLKQIKSDTYQQEFDKIRLKQNLKGNLRLNGNKQSTVLCEFIIASDSEFFERIGKDKTKRFFHDAYDFVTAKVGGEQFVVSAVVHMDEATPHMHVAFVPVINGKDRKGKPCKRINCSEFWKGRDSYSRLQDEYHDFITSRGHDLKRGEKGSTEKHLSVAEYKLKKVEEKFSETKDKLDEIDSVDEVKTTNFIGNNVLVNKSDFEKISTTAKKYSTVSNSENENIILKSECLNLENEKEALKNENGKLSGQLKELKNNFDEFYYSVKDEVQLINENENLKNENARIGNRVHTLSSEIQALKDANNEYKNQVVENQAVLLDKENEICVLNNELNKAQLLFKSLQDKFDRVMKFIIKKNLQVECEKFIKSIVHQKSR